MSAGSSVLLILAGVLTKLSSSVDDVVWLLPFVTHPTNKADNIKNSCIYVVMMCAVAGVAAAISTGESALVYTARLTNDDVNLPVCRWPSRGSVSSCGDRCCNCAVWGSTDADTSAC